MSRFSSKLVGDYIPRARLTLSEQSQQIYAIGDIHGCIDQLLALEAKIFEDSALRDEEVLIICLGDYVDRGPDSAGVIEHCLSPMPQGYRRICLCGNHDQAFLDFLMHPSPSHHWIGWGGAATLQSYGIDIAKFQASGTDELALTASIKEAVPFAHLDFLRHLPVACSSPWAHFVHAGVRPSTAFERQDDFDLMWIREEFLSDEIAADRLVVHGHTPSKEPLLGPRRVGIDTGAVYGGALTAIRLDGDDHQFLSVPA